MLTNMIRILLVIYFFLPSYAHAYLDPGSASIILTFIVTIIASVTTFFSNIKNKLKKIFKKKNKNKNE